MSIDATKNLDKIISSLIINQSLIIQKISGFPSSNENIFLIDSFENYSPLTSGLYVLNSNINELNEIRYYDINNGWIEISKSSNIIDKTSTNLTFPTSKAVYELFQKISGNISGAIDETILENYALYSDLKYVSGQLSGKADKLDLNNYVTNDDLNKSKEIYYINGYFGDNYLAEVSGLYIDINGETRFYPVEKNSSYEKISIPIEEIISNDESLNTHNTIPTTLSVFKFIKDLSGSIVSNDSFNEEILDNYVTNEELEDYISGKLSGITSGETSFDPSILNDYALNSDLKYVSGQLSGKADKSDLNNYVTNEELSGIISGGTFFDPSILNDYALNSDLKYVSGQLSEKADKSDLNKSKEIYYISGYFGDNYLAEVSGLYIDMNGETRFYSSSGLIYNNISYPISEDIISDIQNNENNNIPTINAVYNFLNEEKDVVSLISSTFDTFTPNINGLYIDQNNEIRYYKDTESINLSVEIVDDLTLNENISYTKIASTFAISNYIKSLEERIAALEAKINS